MDPINIDADSTNADWTKCTWNLPCTRDELMPLLPDREAVERFLELPVAKMNPAIVEELGIRRWYLVAPVEQAHQPDKPAV